MPYVPPTSCPPIGQMPVAVMALYAVIVSRFVDDMELANEILNGGPNRLAEYRAVVDRRSHEHAALVAMFMHPVIRVYEAVAHGASA